MLCRRAKLSHDPNNTAWARSTDRYGHKILQAQGWQPGEQVGFNYNAARPRQIAFPVPSISKDNKLGLGSREFASNNTPGLSGFQLILGRLNGKSEVELKSEERTIKKLNTSSYLERRGTVAFVSGGMLAHMNDLSDEQGTSDVKIPEQHSAKKGEKDTKDYKSSNLSEDGDASRSGSHNVPIMPQKAQSTSSERKHERKQKRRAERKTDKQKEAGRQLIHSESVAVPQESLPAAIGRSHFEKRKEENGEAEHSLSQSRHSAAASNGGLSRYGVRSRQIAQNKLAVADAKALNEVRHDCLVGRCHRPRFD